MILTQEIIDIITTEFKKRDKKIEQLKKDLKKYGKHSMQCGKGSPKVENGIIGEWGCTCEFEQALKEE